MKYNIDPQIKPFCLSIPFKAPLIALSHKPMDIMLKFVHRKGVKERTVSFEGCPIDIYEKDGLDYTAPCIIFYHGGGFGFKAAPHHKSLALRLADELNCRIICPDYGLLPCEKYPKARKDALKAYRYAYMRYPKSNFAVMGDSAGGALTTYVVYDAEKAGLKAPKLQMLLYPVIDAACTTKSMEKFTDTPLWNAVNNREMWSMYLEGADVTEASPMQAKLPNHIPPTYVEVAEFDCLRDEGIAYAERLKNAGALVELFETKGTPHGYDIASHSDVMKECMSKRLAALKGAVRQ